MTIIYKIYNFLIQKIRNNRLICYVIFSVWYKNRKYGAYWDWVTLELASVLRRYLRNNTVLLDLGTGPYGILCFYADNLRRNCTILGADYCNELVENARSVNTRKHIHFIQSDLFGSIKQKFDFITFNAPYIDVQLGKTLGVFVDELSEKRWSGGKGGIDTIARFLADGTKYLHDDGICALGINNYYVEHSLVLKLIDDCGLRLIGNSKNIFTKANVYLLKRNA